MSSKRMQTFCLAWADEILSLVAREFGKGQLMLAATIRKSRIVQPKGSRQVTRTVELYAQMAEGQKLDTAIKNNLKGLGYGG
jgi:hypothetical protein